MESGHSTAVHYAKSRLEMKEPEANNLLLAGRRLDELPLVDAALVAGEISWSKMMILQRVAVPDTQIEWLEFAEDMNCRKLAIPNTGRSAARRANPPSGMATVVSPRFG